MKIFALIKGCFFFLLEEGGHINPLRSLSYFNGPIVFMTIASLENHLIRIIEGVRKIFCLKKSVFWCRTLWVIETDVFQINWIVAKLTTTCHFLRITFFSYSLKNWARINLRMYTTPLYGTIQIHSNNDVHLFRIFYFLVKWTILFVSDFFSSIFWWEKSLNYFFL